MVRARIPRTEQGAGFLKAVGMLTLLVVVLVSVLPWDGDREEERGTAATTREQSVPTGGATSPALDIVITGVRMSPTPSTSPAVLVRASEYEYRAEVTNEGEAGVSGVMTVLRWDCDLVSGGGVESGQQEMWVADLGAGETKESAPARMTTPDGTGSCLVEVIVDPENVLTESDESALSNVWSVVLQLI